MHFRGDKHSYLTLISPVQTIACLATCSVIFQRYRVCSLPRYQYSMVVPLGLADVGISTCTLQRRSMDNTDSSRWHIIALLTGKWLMQWIVNTIDLNRLLFLQKRNNETNIIFEISPESCFCGMASLRIEPPDTCTCHVFKPNTILHIYKALALLRFI